LEALIGAPLWVAVDMAKETARRSPGSAALVWETFGRELAALLPPGVGCWVSKGIAGGVPGKD
jgi:hypothetical protein